MKRETEEMKGRRSGSAGGGSKTLPYDNPYRIFDIFGLDVSTQRHLLRKKEMTTNGGFI